MLLTYGTMLLELLIQNVRNDKFSHTVFTLFSWWSRTSLKCLSSLLSGWICLHGVLD